MPLLAHQFDFRLKIMFIVCTFCSRGTFEIHLVHVVLAYFCIFYFKISQLQVLNSCLSVPAVLVLEAIGSKLAFQTFGE